jgi:hypothetical protein
LASLFRQDWGIYAKSPLGGPIFCMVIWPTTPIARPSPITVYVAFEHFERDQVALRPNDYAHLNKKVWAQF